MSLKIKRKILIEHSNFRMKSNRFLKENIRMPVLPVNPVNSTEFV